MLRRTFGAFIVVLVVLATALGGCATQQPAPDPGGTQPVIPSLTEVRAQQGHVPDDAAAGTQLAAINVTVTLGGAPAGGVRVVLHPVTLEKPLDQYPNARTDDQGRVSFDRVPVDDNLRLRVETATAGTYAVTGLTAGQVLAFTAAR